MCLYSYVRIASHAYVIAIANKLAIYAIEIAIYISYLILYRYV